MILRIFSTVMWNDSMAFGVELVYKLENHSQNS